MFLLQTLLDLGASPDYKDSYGLTPLYHTAVVGGDPGCCELLLHEQAAVCCRDENGWHEVHQVRAAPAARVRAPRARFRGPARPQRRREAEAARRRGRGERTEGRGGGGAAWCGRREGAPASPSSCR